jgi:chromosomal replication initiator protein
VTPYDTDIETTILQAIAQCIGTERFALWFGSEVRFSMDENRLAFEVASPFIQKVLEDDYRASIQHACTAVLGRSYEIAFVVPDPATGAQWQIDLAREARLSTDTRASGSDLVQKKSPARRAEPPEIHRSSDHELLIIPRLSPAKETSRNSQSLAQEGTLPEETTSLFSSFQKEFRAQTAHRASTPSHRSESKTRKKLPPKPVSPFRRECPGDRTERKRTADLSSSNRRVSKKQYASLETFHEGLSNRLAMKAIELAIHFPGKFTPIYLHGPTSVGKTHLLEGLYTTLRKSGRRGHPLYMTSEQFTAEFLQGLQQGAPSFRNKFKDLSALLIDDLQFFLGKSATQGELLRLMDHLLRENVQLVFTGNAPLKELKGLRPELIARIESGMVCGIKPPERTTLLAVFQRMARERHVDIPEDVARFVVSRLNVHARQLSGALNRLLAASMVSGQRISIEMARETLDDMIRHNRRSIRLQDIDQAVRERFELEPKKLQSKSRARYVSHPRMLAMWLARKYTRSALTEIGQYFGNRSHTTVISAQKRVDQWIADNARLNVLESDLCVGDALEHIEHELLAG